MKMRIPNGGSSALLALCFISGFCQTGRSADSFLLHEALANRDIRAAMEAIPHTGDLDARDSEGRTPLCLAVEQANPKAYRVVQELLVRGPIQIGAAAKALCPCRGRSPTATRPWSRRS